MRNPETFLTRRSGPTTPLRSVTLEILAVPTGCLIVTVAARIKLSIELSEVRLTPFNGGPPMKPFHAGVLKNSFNDLTAWMLVAMSNGVDRNAGSMSGWSNAEADAKVIEPPSSGIVSVVCGVQ